MTKWSGQTPTNIEDQVTYPITIGMQGLAGVRDVRAMSQLGISMVTVIFEDNVDEYFARDRVNELLPYPCRFTTMSKANFMTGCYMIVTNFYVYIRK
ncbi:MAG: efflux RND transporter permease subunit [Candidatus Gracilibacteria bacterium]|nr:efflux RND transporter permease subunit [Candidatus Gracilibacteria bacterium]